MKKFIVVFFSLVFIVLVYFFYAQKAAQIEDQTYYEHAQQVQQKFRQEVEKKHGNTASLTYLISQDKNIVEALVQKDASLLDFTAHINMIQQYGDYQNLWIQVIDGKGYSFYRSWSDKVGDHAASARVDVVQMLKDPKPMQTISTGRFDMTFKTMLPIYNKGEFIGMVEMISKFNSIANEFEKEGVKPLFVLHEEYTSRFIEPFSKLFIGQNYVANLNADKKLMQKVEKFGLQKLLQMDGYMEFDSFLAVLDEIQDINGKEMGYFLFFMPKDRVDSTAVEQFKTTFLTFVVLFLIITILGGLYLLNRGYVKKLSSEVEKQTKKLQELNKNLNKEVKTQVAQISKKDKMLQEQSKLAAMGEMMSAVAHQWRQPLNALSLNIQNLEDDYEEGVDR